MQKKQQRIKLRPEGSPVKFDATIIESTPDGKRIKVSFDGPLDDLELFAFGTRMLSNMRDRDGQPVEAVMQAVKSQEWEVL